MFRIKICGLKTEADVNAALASNTEAVGFNFYAPSVRYVAPNVAKMLAMQLPAQFTKIGLFVNESVENILSIMHHCQFNWVQLHGDEPPELLSQLHPFPIIRAFRLRAENITQVIQYLQTCEALSCFPQAVLLDAYHPQQYGGTGERVSAELFQQVRSAFPRVPLILAGGLNPDNVAQAIHSLQPDGVDTASGVESTPGVKDVVKSCAFVTSAQEAFGKLTGNAQKN
jgi:phosphoribosylanthranilate isomerase